MKRFVTSALLLAFAAPLSACGISGPLKTPPPVWGQAKPLPAANDAGVTEVDANDAATADDDMAVKPVSTNPLDALANDDEDDDKVGYGANVADTP